MSNSAALTDFSLDLVRELRARLDRGELELPLLSTAANDILSLALDPDVHAKELASRISGDPSVMTHVLRIANSPLYRGAMDIVSVKQAVGRLGVDLIAHIASTIAIKNGVFSNPRYEQAIAALWRRSLLRALWAREIARYQRSEIDLAYLGGLIRDIGQACVYRELDRYALREKIEISTEQAQPIVLALSCQAGLRLADRWQLPEALIELFEFHVKIGRSSRLVQQIEAADNFLKNPEYLETENAEILIKEAWATSLGINERGWSSIVASQDRVIQTAMALS